MNKRALLSIATMAFFLVSCGSDDEGPSTGETSSVLVVNEGNFGQGNGSITSYNPETGVVTDHVFETANNGRPLGDVVQSAVFDSEAGGYIVVNNSRKIEVVDPGFVSTSTIEADLANPRFLVKAGNQLFVSNWGNFDDNFALDQSYVLILDAGSLEKKGLVETNDGTENLIFADGYVYASNNFGNTVSVIDASEGTLKATLEVGWSPGEMTIDSKGSVWLICGGSYQGNDGALYLLTPTEAEKSTELGVNPGTRLAIDVSADVLYYVNGTEVGKYETGSGTLTKRFISEDSAVGFYGIGFNDAEKVLYVADAKGFQGKGTVYRFSTDGATISTFEAGVGPNGFVFVR